jgi:hypothetical protein
VVEGKTDLIEYCTVYIFHKIVLYIPIPMYPVVDGKTDLIEYCIIFHTFLYIYFYSYAEVREK